MATAAAQQPPLAQQDASMPKKPSTSRSIIAGALAGAIEICELDIGIILPSAIANLLSVRSHHVPSRV